MDVRPTGSSVAPTAALDALQRVHAGASADDSEDSQTAGYLFGDSKRDREESGPEADERSPDAVLVTVELSAESLAIHPAVTVAPDIDPGSSSREVESRPSPAERHIDIEA
jgi:hypothetical protein